MTPYISKQYTIWHFGLMFCNKTKFDQMQSTPWEFPDDVVFKGHLDQMPDSIAQMVAEIHPNAPQYFEHAMMPLFRGYSTATHFKGTESAKLAITTRMSQPDQENGCNHIIIWWMVKTEL